MSPISKNSKRGSLFIVSTPIGNLEDMTLRALRILKEVDLITAEDTRHTGLLLKHFGIKTPLTSYFEENELKKREWVLSRLKRGDQVALVSDAGTPGVSDPGYRLIQLAIEHDIPVIPIPGPSALIAALSVSGLPTDAFIFKGFLPRKSKKRRDCLQELKEVRETLIFYESPHRLLKTLHDIYEILGDREIVVARELTKVYEEILRGRVGEIIEKIGRRKLKGEITLVVSGKSRREKAPLTPEGTSKDHQNRKEF
ncbi:MAG: 16S rRNA (cytidine(1402)-2'-O)-methyltransferase [Thermodesulfobacteriota bacterium]